MLCTCKPMMVVPVREELSQTYWGYIHAADKKWKIKRWIPTNPYMNKCDRCIAQEDYILQRENDIILHVGAWVVYAQNMDHAVEILEGLRIGKLDLDTWHKSTNRFVDLLDELYTI